MLEPSSAHCLVPSRFRALAHRCGFDLEPELPDPAPAYVDPEGALHPALTETIAAMPLHSWPTPAARASAVARALSEPGRFDPTDPEDPFVRLTRFAERTAMEPEARGALTLLLLRGLLAVKQRTHQPDLPDPSEMLHDPDLDAHRRRRARLRDAPEASDLIRKVLTLASQTTDEDAYAFERVVLHGAARWLPLLQCWGVVQDALGPLERIPDDIGARGVLRTALNAVTDSLSALADAPSGQRPVQALAACLSAGAAAEEHFLSLSGATPDGPVHARWMLTQQIRAMRDLSRFTRPHALGMHAALRDCDVLRLASHLAWRTVALSLWLDDVEGCNPAEVEAAIDAIPDPPHDTTLFAGLGRLRGFVLVRRLRRGQVGGGLDRAAAALKLAPQELAIQITSNDLRFAAGERSSEFLGSVRDEMGRYRSVTAALMGSRIADAVGERGRARAYREQMLQHAGPPTDFPRWFLHASELLACAPGTVQTAAIVALIEKVPAPEGPPGPLLILLGAGSDPETALTDTLTALREQRSNAESRDASRRALAAAGKLPGWRRVAARPPIPADDGELVPRLFDRLSDLRASSHDARQTPLARPLGRLCTALSRAADGGVEPLPSSTTKSLGSALPRLIAALGGEADSSEVAAELDSVGRAVEAHQRGPRIAHLREELSALRARARSRGDDELGARLATLSRQLDKAAGLSSPDRALDTLDEALTLVDEVARTPSQAADDTPPAMSVHPDFDRFSRDELGMRPDAIRRARQLIALFNEADGKRDRKRLKGAQQERLFELRHRTRHLGGLRVFYRADGPRWQALAAMSKYDDRPQRAAIAKVVSRFLEA